MEKMKKVSVTRDVAPVQVMGTNGVASEMQGKITSKCGLFACVLIKKNWWALVHIPTGLWIKSPKRDGFFKSQGECTMAIAYLHNKSTINWTLGRPDMIAGIGGEPTFVATINQLVNESLEA